jgi:hypothetical protein
VNKKIVGIALVVMLGVILVESYFLFVQPNQNVPDVENTADSTSQSPVTSSTNESTTELPNAQTSREVPEINSFVPAVPEFTVQLVDSSYDVPTTYSTDPYTGKQVTHSGYHIARRTIEIRIKNQPYTPYTSYGQESKFYYNVRYKGYFGGDWFEVYHPEEMPTQSNSEYTVISFNDVGDGGFYLAPAPRMLVVSPDGQVDFQVKALAGFASEGSPFVGIPDSFAGKESYWSATQTLTIP